MKVSSFRKKDNTWLLNSNPVMAAYQNVCNIAHMSISQKIRRMLFNNQDAICAVFAAQAEHNYVHTHATHQK